MSILNPVYACRFVEPGNPVALDNKPLPGRPQPGDTFTHRGVVRKVVSVTVDWSALPASGSMTPQRIPALVVVE